MAIQALPPVSFRYFGTRSQANLHEAALVVRDDLTYRIGIGDWSAVEACTLDLQNILIYRGVAVSPPNVLTEQGCRAAAFADRGAVARYGQHGLAVHLGLGAWQQVATGVSALRAIALVQLAMTRSV